jgi:hypothetical protein
LDIHCRGRQLREKQNAHLFHYFERHGWAE